jgi:hypothetical protein
LSTRTPAIGAVIGSACQSEPGRVVVS